MNEAALVLVVEDDEDDFFFTQRALRKFTAAPVFHLESGRAAIAYLSGAGIYASRSEFPFPQIVFIDLKMDTVSGHDVLLWVRDHLPAPWPKIYILTGSNEPRDRELVRNSGVAVDYFVKPLTVPDLTTIFGPPPPVGSSLP